MEISTSERRRKTEGTEYDTPPPIPCTPKKLDVLLDKWIVDGSSLIKFLGSPQRRSGGTHTFVVYTTTYNILSQNVGRFTDWCIAGSKKVL